MLKLAAESIEELAKENPSSEIVEYKTKDFLKTLEVGVYTNGRCIQAAMYELQSVCELSTFTIAGLYLVSSE